MVAITRNRSRQVVEVQTVKIETPAKISKPRKASTKAAPKKTKINLEDALKHIEVPEDGQLPQSFVDYHQPEFIEGAKFILAKDPSLYRAIVHRPFEVFAKQEAPEVSDEALIDSYWYSLISSVVSQQVSGASARAIEQKFKALFEGEKVTAANTLKKTPEQLKSAGFSGQKTGYAFHISEVFSNPDSKLANPAFYNSSIDDILEELVSLKGIGMWSAKMFAIFTLKKLDIFAYDDLGVARGISRYFVKRPSVFKEVKEQVHSIEDYSVLLKRKSKFEKKDSKRDWTPYHDSYVIFFGQQFSPYQTILMLIMWRLGSTNLEVLESTGIRRPDADTQ